MKIIIDECLPKRLTQFFEKDLAYTVPQIGLSGSTDSELLEELDRRGVDIFITIDGNIEYQQQFLKRKFGTVVILAVSNRFSDLERLKDKILDAVNVVAKGEIEHVS
jgi:predicted nuclease of predicted toxin-antitoxin system